MVPLVILSDVTFQHIKRADKFGIANLIYAVCDSGDGKESDFVSSLTFLKSVQIRIRHHVSGPRCMGNSSYFDFLLLCHFSTCTGLLCQVTLSSWDLPCMGVV